MYPGGVVGRRYGTRRCSGDDVTGPGGAGWCTRATYRSEEYRIAYRPALRDIAPLSGYTQHPTASSWHAMRWCRAGQWDVTELWALFLNPSWVTAPGTSCSHLSCLIPSVRMSSASQIDNANGHKDRMLLGTSGF